MATRYTIVNAPGKFDLADAFFGKDDDRHHDGRRTVTFEIAPRKAGDEQPHFSGVVLVVNSLSWEDGSGDSWIFSGYIHTLRIPSGGNMAIANISKANGWFSTKRRVGWIKLTS